MKKKQQKTNFYIDNSFQDLFLILRINSKKKFFVKQKIHKIQVFFFVFICLIPRPSILWLFFLSVSLFFIFYKNIAEIFLDVIWICIL